MSDDLGYEVIGANGGTSYKTPFIDSMAEKGMRFENAHVMPLCTPTRLSLMTGKYNFRNYMIISHIRTINIMRSKYDSSFKMSAIQ